MIEQKDYLDYQQGGDTGEDITDAIQPVSDGETATQTTFRRPSENLRGRTEVARDIIRDLLYYRDHNHLVLEGGSGGSIAWAGSVTSGASGAITQTGDLTIRPLLTPPTSTKGSITIGTGGSDNEITYAVASSAYATEGMNAVTVAHVDAGGGASLSVDISDGPVKRITVSFDSTNTSHDAPAVKTAVDTAVSGDSDLSGKITTTAVGSAGNTVDAQAETRITGTADQEAHVISSGTLDTFTSSNPLDEGDAVGIWYKYVIEPASGDSEDPKGGVAGGRWESNPDRSTASIPIDSLFVTRTDPDKIPGAVPLCKVLNGELVWVDGSRYAKGASGPIGTVSSLYIDDSNFQGDATNLVAGGIPKSATSAQEAFELVDTRLGELRVATYTCSDGANSTGGDFSGSDAIQNAITQLGGTGGIIFLRRGTYFLDDTTNLGSGVDVEIIGEERTLVSLTQSTPTQFTFENNLRLRNVTLDSNITYEIQSGTRDVTLQNIDIKQGTLDVQGIRSYIENLEWTTTTTGTSYQIDDNGISSTYRNIDVEGKVRFQGRNTIVDTIELHKDHDSSAIEVLGTNNKVTGIYISDITDGMASASSALVSLGGTNCSVEYAWINSSTSPLSQGWGFVIEDQSLNAALRHCKLVGGDHGGLHIKSPSDIFDTDVVGAVIKNCHITNDSDSNNTLECSSSNGDVYASFEGCTFDDSENVNNKVASIEVLSSDNNIVFTNCRFVGATYDSNTAGSFSGCSFYNCYFQLKNPVDGGLGIRLLPGTDQSGDTLWRILGTNVIGSSAYKRLQPIVKDCIFDALDSEVVNESGTGDPVTDLVHLSISSVQLVNPNFINLSRYGLYSEGSGSSSGGIVHLSDAVMVGGTFEWTDTAFAQTPSGSASSLDGWIRVVGNGVTIKDLRVESGDIDTSVSGISTTIVNLDRNTIDDFTMLDCVFTAEDNTGDLIPFSAENAGHARMRLERCKFGSNSQPLSSTLFPLYFGTDSIVQNCEFWFDSTSDLPDIAFTSGTVTRCKFIGNLYINTATTDPSSKHFFELTGTDLIDGFVFSGNHLEATGDGTVGTRKVFDGVPSAANNVVAAGNVVIDNDGSASTVDGDIDLTTLNVGF